MMSLMERLGDGNGANCTNYDGLGRFIWDTSTE
jgi:hypothetical protein